MDTKKVIAGFATAAALGGGTLVTDQVINPYTDLGTKLEIVAESTLVDAGMNKVELAKDRPAITLGKWNDEVALTISYDKVQAEGSRAFLTDRMEWKGGKEEVHAYPLEAKEGMEDGGVEIEIVLNEKPDTNIFEFQIVGADQLDFFYQPELTAEEIAEGASRPENVVGSYAVYHKSKANHRLGSTNYATGKAYHVYRPKAFDANGIEVWAELYYVNGILNVTVPQKFLDDAVYPVKVDPTFGYTTCGASTSFIAGNTGDQNRRVGDAVTGASGTLDKISACLKMTSSNDTVDVTAFLNTEDAAANSHAEIAEIERTNLSITTTVAVFDFTASSQSLSSVSYVINLLGDGEDVAGAGDSAVTMFDSISSHNRYSEQINGVGGYTTLKEDPWTVAEAASSNTNSVYATYTASAAAAPTVNNEVFDLTDE